MLHRLLLLALLAALIVPVTADAEVTIKIGKGKFQQQKYRETLYGRAFRVKGKTGAYRGPVTLEIDEFPFDGSYSDMATVNTNDKGEYVFPRIGPTRNAHLRVRAGYERSRPLSVFVFPNFRFDYGTTRDGYRVRVSLTYIGHPGFTPPQDATFLYIQINKEEARRFGGVRRLTNIGDGKWRYSATIDLPRRRHDYRYFLGFCTRGLAASGYGRDWPGDHTCGNKRL